MKKEITIPSDSETKVAKSTTISGDIETTGGLLVNGRIEGSVTSHDDVYVGKTAVVNGNITAKNAYIFGVVQGNVISDGTVYMSASSKLFGNVHAQSFKIEKGSVYKGSCETSDHVEDIDKIENIDTEITHNKIKEDSIIENI